ncbi:MAG: galactose oxidase early set domain-containing protein, partial [Planctomycetota bacterium]
GPALEWDRYYPTVTLTSRLTRTFGREVAIVTGGSEVIGQSFDMTTNPPSNPTWNTYEGLVLLDPTNTATPTGLAVDTFGTGTNVVRTFEGPDDQVQQNRLLEEYPRVHWIDSNEIVTSGYGPLSSKVQHEVPPIQPGAWSYSTGQSSIPMPGPNIPSFVHRHDGASVMFARYGALTNFIGRMGGFTEEFGGGAATSTTEYIPNAAGAPGTQWVQGPYMVQSRAWLNAVVLPDSTVVVVGGVPTREPTVATLAQWLAIAQGAELLVNGAFVTLPSATTPRGYHATAVLLPDGRVLVGGGEGRRDFVTPSFDYEIYSPWYMTQLRPSIMAISQSPSLGANPDGSTKVQYNSALTIDLTLPKFVGMGKIVLMAPGSVTHHSDMHARYVELEQIGAIIDMSSGVAKVVCSMPPEGLAPRGYYMVFAVTAGGVPSPAGWIQITN